MGTASSREVLFGSRQPGESVRDPKWHLKPFFKNHRLVRDELRQEVQHCVHDQQASVCDSVSVVQESSKSVQQKDVRPVLPMQEDQVQGSRHNSGTA